MKFGATIALGHGLKQTSGCFLAQMWIQELLKWFCNTERCTFLNNRPLSSSFLDEKICLIVCVNLFRSRSRCSLKSLKKKHIHTFKTTLAKTVSHWVLCSLNMVSFGSAMNVYMSFLNRLQLKSLWSYLIHYNTHSRDVTGFL